MENEVRKSLEESLIWEDGFILKYDTEIVWELLRTLGKDKFSRIEPLLKQNIRETQIHRLEIKKLLEGMG